MLQTLRDRIQGWIAGLIISILVFAFALWGIQYYLEGGGSTNVVAKVNGNPITQQQWDAAYQRLKQTLQATNRLPSNADTAAQEQLKQQALQQLITAQVLADAAVKGNYRIDPEQLNAAIMQFPPFLINGNFSQERFQQVLNMLGYSPQQFFADFERTLLVGQSQTGIVSSSIGLPNEAKQAAQLINQKRDIRYVVIPAARFLAAQKVSEPDINTFYQQHQQNFATPEKVSIDYLELSADEIAKTIQVNAQDMQQYYQDNMSSFVKNGKTQPFAEVKAEIEKGLRQQKLQQAFSDQSEKLSDLTYTNPNSLTPAAQALGLKIQSTDFFTRSGEKSGITANPQVVSTAFNDDVLKNGNNSNVLPIKDGQVIVLRLKSFQPVAIRPLAEVKDQIMQILQTQAAQKNAQQMGAEVLAKLQTGETLEKAGQPYHLVWQTKNEVTRQVSGIDSQILRSAFNLPRTATNNPAVAGVTLANGDYAIVSVTNIKDGQIPATTQSLNVMQGEIENNFGQLEYQLYVDNLLKHAKIKRYGNQKS